MEQPENTTAVIPDYVLGDDPDLREKLGKHLGGVRKLRRLSQEVVAKEVGLSRPHLSNIELGRSRAGWPGLQRMAAYFELDIRQLIADLGARLSPERHARVDAVTLGEPSLVIEAKEQSFGSNLTDYERFVLSGFHLLSKSDRARVLAEVLALIKDRHGL